ncbi:neutrophil cytosol factor 2 isoform 2-T2 [Aulostomus maculatus]
MQLKRYEECLADFQHSFKALRGNQLIDYKALGLRHKLYACEILNNMALAEAQMDHWEEAQKNLLKALNYKTETKLTIIDKALQSTLKQRLFRLVEFPSKELFKPNKHYVAELERKDYLGKAKVVASVIPQDDFSGFAPLQPQVDNGPAHPKEPEVLRALEGEPHTVLYEFVPATSDELAVVPGNIVFVLQKGSDNWASVVFNGRKGLVPYNYLQHLEISLDSKQMKEGSEPRSREPPNRPKRNKGLTPGETGNGDVQSEDAPSADNPCIIKVYHTFTFAFLLTPGAPYATLIDKISKKLNVSSNSITLSLTLDTSGHSRIDADTDMESVWSQADHGRITMWCYITEQNMAKPQHEIQYVALHSYESSNREDLNFNQGDTITLLCKVNEDWLEGQCNGQTGIFPAAFVEEAPVNGQ